MNYCSMCGLNYSTAIHNCTRQSMNYIGVTPFVNQGWQCPICLAVYSPITPRCWNDHQPTLTTTNTTAQKPKKGE